MVRLIANNQTKQLYHSKQYADSISSYNAVYLHGIILKHEENELVFSFIQFSIFFGLCVCVCVCVCVCDAVSPSLLPFHLQVWQ